MRRFTLILVSLACALTACKDAPTTPRKQQVVKLLPDTPPPPPPVKPEDRPPPKPEDKPQPQEAPKPAEVPQAQALKSDEAAGDGPGNGLTAGTVSKDYQGGAIGGAQIGSVATDGGSNLLAATTFANGATRSLNEFLVRDKDVKRLDYRVRVDLWLTPTGALDRAELVGSTGDAQTDQALRGALSRFPGMSMPLPAKMPLPIRVQVSNRLMG